MLVQLQKVPAVLVQHGKVRGKDDLFCINLPLGRSSKARRKLQHPRVFIDGQLLCDGGGELQRIELRLTGNADRTGGLYGQWQGVDPPRGHAQALERGELAVDQRPILHGVDKVVLPLKIAVHPGAERAVGVQRALIGAEVHLRPLPPEALHQLVVDQAVLHGELGRRVLGNPAAEIRGLHERTVHACLPEHVRAQDARQTAADDQHVRPPIGMQRRKGR